MEVGKWVNWRDSNGFEAEYAGCAVKLDVEM